MAFHGSNSYNETGLSKITDIVGWNLYQGWYGGDLTGFEKFLAQQHQNHPTHPMIVSEYGAGSDKRLHSLHPRAFDFSIEYQQKYLEHYLPVLEDTPYICGGTHWNFIDFSSALRDESMPRINNKGWFMPTVPRKMYITTIRQLGARTFRCYILPAATGQTVPACSKAMLPYICRSRYTPTFLR